MKYKLYNKALKDVLGIYTVKQLINLHSTQSTAKELHILQNLSDITFLQSTGVEDKTGEMIFEDDILESPQGKYFRVYLAPGGFVVKSTYWAEDKEDLDGTDMLITDPLADAQTFSYISLQCAVVGNYNYQ